MNKRSRTINRIDHETIFPFRAAFSGFLTVDPVIGKMFFQFSDDEILNSAVCIGHQIAYIALRVNIDIFQRELIRIGHRTSLLRQIFEKFDHFSNFGFNICFHCRKNGSSAG